MGGVQRFEDLVAWQKARALTKAIYRMTSDDRLARDLRFSGQIQSAAVSVMSNIAEGFERGGAGEFHRFLVIAKASCAEVRSLLYVAIDAEFIDTKTFERLQRQAEEVSRVVGGLRASVERSRDATSRSIREDAASYDADSFALDSEA